MTLMVGFFFFKKTRGAAEGPPVPMPAMKASMRLRFAPRFRGRWFHNEHVGFSESEVLVGQKASPEFGRDAFCNVAVVSGAWVRPSRRE